MMTCLSRQELCKKLRDNGYKVTPQRLAIYEELAGTDSHPTAEALFKKLQRNNPYMSFATIYKAMGILVKIGAVRMLNTGETSSRYDARMDEHYHVQCTCCGMVYDIFDLPTEKLTQAVTKQSGVKIQNSDFYFYGICKNCQ